MRELLHIALIAVSRAFIDSIWKNLEGGMREHKIDRIKPIMYTLMSAFVGLMIAAALIS